MTMWKRLAITVVAMLAASIVLSLLWHTVFNVRVPGYLSGVIGGLAALATWEFLRSRK